jgi:hypothetical protein
MNKKYAAICFSCSVNAGHFIEECTEIDNDTQ